MNFHFNSLPDCIFFTNDPLRFSTYSQYLVRISLEYNMCYKKFQNEKNDENYDENEIKNEKISENYDENENLEPRNLQQ